MEEKITSETVKEIDESQDIENKKRVEAALFLSARYLNLQELVMLTDINPLMLKEVLEKLEADTSYGESVRKFGLQIARSRLGEDNR